MALENKSFWISHKHASSYVIKKTSNDSPYKSHTDKEYNHVVLSRQKFISLEF